MASDDEVVIKVQADLAAALSALGSLEEQFQSLIDGLKKLAAQAAANGESTEVFDAAILKLSESFTTTFAQAQANVVEATQAFAATTIEAVGYVETAKIANEEFGETVEVVAAKLGMSTEAIQANSDVAEDSTQKLAGLQERLHELNEQRLQDAVSIALMTTKEKEETIELASALLKQGESLEAVAAQAGLSADAMRLLFEEQAAYKKSVEDSVDPLERLAQSLDAIYKQQQADQELLASMTDSYKDSLATMSQELLNTSVSFAAVAEKAGLTTDQLTLLFAEQQALKQSIEDSIDPLTRLRESLEELNKQQQEDVASIEKMTDAYKESVADMSRELLKQGMAFKDVAAKARLTEDALRLLFEEQNNLKKAVQDSIDPLDRLGESLKQLHDQQAKDQSVLASMTQDYKKSLSDMSQELLKAGESFDVITEKTGLTREQLTLIINEQNKLAESSKSFWQRWVEDVDDGQVATIAWGVVVGKAFGDVQKGIENLITSFPRMITQLADAGDAARTLASRLQTTVESIVQLQYVGKQAGVSVELMARTMQTLSLQLSDVNSKSTVAVKNLGLIPAELQKLNVTQGLAAVLDKLKQIPDAAERSAVFFEIFGTRARGMTQLMDEDMKKLLGDFESLGGLENQKRLADLGDEMNDLSENIKVVGDSFKREIAVKVIPVINDLLEKMPKLGGAAITIGESFGDLAKSLLPLVANMVTLAGGKGVKGLLIELNALALKLPFVKLALDALGWSIKGVAASFGILTLAVTAALAIFETWKAASAETGWARDLSDYVEKVSLRFQGFSNSAADAIIKAEHLRQKTNELAEAKRKLAQEEAAAHPYTEVILPASDALAKAIARINAEYQSLLNGDYIGQVTAALKQNVLTMEDIAKGGFTTVDAVKMLKEALADAEKAASKSPFAKFREDIKQFAEQLKLANDAGRTGAKMLELFGEEAQKVRTAALSIPGGLREITTEMLALAEAADLKDTNDMMDDFHKTTLKVAAVWTGQMKAAAQAWADFTGKQLTAAIVNISTIQQQLTMNQQVGLDKRLAQLEAAEAKEIAAALEAAKAKGVIATMEYNAIRDKYNDLRALEKQYTGDVARDMELRGQKTKKELETVAAAERAHFLDMEAIWKTGEANFTKIQLEAQRQRAENAEKEAKGEIKIRQKIISGISNALNETANSFQRLATIGNKSMGQVAEGLAIAADAAKGFEDVSALLEAKDTIGAIIAAAKMAVQAIVAMWDAFTKSPGEDVMGRVGQRLGVAIGEEMGDTIAKTAKDKFKGDRFAAEIFHLSDIIEAAGGLTEKNFDKMLGGLRDTFALLEKKTLTVDQAREVLDKNFGAFAEHVVNSGKVASAAFVEMIQLNQQFGTQSKEISAFVAGQVEKLGEAFEKLVSPLAKQAEPFKDLKKETDELGKLTADRAKAIADATAKAVKGGREEKKALEELQKTGSVAIDAQKKKVDELLAKQKEVASKSMPEIERAGRLMMASFNGSIKSGVSMLDAVEKLGPGLDSILTTMGNLGIDVEKSSVSYIVQFRNRVNANKELVESTASLNEIMLSMSNIGALDADSFKDLQTQGLESYAKLEAAGFKQNERLTMMKGFLESARDAHASMGLPIDENTAKLIAEAEATGVLSEKQLDGNKIMMEGLGAIITAVGGTLPAAWDTAAKAGVAAAKTISEGVDSTINATLEEQNKQLQEDAWAENARDAERASLKIRTSIGKVDGKLDLVDQALEHNEWGGWADDAIDAAGRVEDAVDGVSMGHSPGGLKEIPLKLRAANDAFKVWERIGVQSAENVQDTIDSMRGRDLGMSGLRTAGIATQMPSGDFVREVSGADAERTDAPVNLTFNITSMDPAGVELVTERKILPAMVKILRRGRNLADMQTVLNLKG